jgi:hypothetical protein
MNSQELRNLQEAYLEVYENIMEKEDSPYEKASDAALDSRYGYGRATGDKHSFGRAANRSSAAAALRAIRRDERSGSETSREAGSNAVHQGWAKTAKTSTDQTPEKKDRRSKLANTSYSNLPDDEKEKDRVSFDAVRAVYNRNKTKKEEYDIYDIIFLHLLDEGYADTNENALVIMTNMSEEWRESILLDENLRRSEYLAQKGTPEERKERRKIMRQNAKKAEKEASTNNLIRSLKPPEPRKPDRVGNPSAATPSGEGLNPENKPPRPRVVTPYVPPIDPSTGAPVDLAARTSKIKPFGTVKPPFIPPAAPKKIR